MTRLAFALFVLATVSAAGPAEAVPALARRYRTSCTTCHQWGFPYLNPWGVRFRQNGYQLPEGAEDPARARAMIEPGTIADRSGLFATPPISLRSRVLAEWSETATDTQKRVRMKVPYVRTQIGGSLYEDVSMVIVADLAPSPFLHFATVGFHDLLGDGGLSILAGKLNMTGFQRAGHYSVTRLGSPLASVAVGRNPFVLEGEHYGITFAGRPRWGPLAYELSVVTGAPGPAGEVEPDRFKDLIGRVTYTPFGEHTVGGFAYVGRTRLQVDTGGIDREWDDRFALTGGDLQVNFWRLSLYAAGLYGRHDDPTGEGTEVGYTGLRAEALWAVTDALSTIVRYDAVESDDDPSLRHRLLTLHAGYLVLTSLRLSLEGTRDLRSSRETRALAFVEVAL